MMPLFPPERLFMIASPYLLYLGHVNDEVGIKTSRGLAVFRPDDCVGEFRHDGYDTAARDCVQIHGGIGVTWEAGLHLHMRRARSLAVRSEEHTSELQSIMRISYAC